ncbi:MAG: cobalamin-dependent protein [Spirochaetia bacterium]
MRSPRALLIQPPIYDFALYDLFHQPFGLLRIGRWLEDSGYHVELLDSLDPVPAGRTHAGRGKFHRQVVDRPPSLQGVDRLFARYGAPEETIRERIRAADPDVVLVTTGMTYWYPGIAEIAALVREVRPDAPLIAGGVYATLLPDHCAEQLGSDLVVRGAADGKLGGMLAGLGLPEPQGEVPYLPSVGLRTASGRLHGAAAIRLQEGCPHRCAYCASPIISPRLQAGDPAALLEHIIELHEHLGISAFAFYDDALLHDADRGLRPLLDGILNRYGSRELALYLPNAVHLDYITDDLAGLMHEAGFREIRFGLESTDSAFHSTLDSKLLPERVAGKVESLLRAGFTGGRITAYILVGLPGQKFAGVRRTLADAARFGINVSLAEYSPVPGTPLYAAARESSGLDLDGEPLLHNNSVFPLLSGQLTAAQMSETRATVRSIRRTFGRGTMM